MSQVTGESDEHLYGMVSRTLSEAVNLWKRITHPAWPMILPHSTLERINGAIWAITSRCTDLTAGSMNVLLVHSHLPLSYHTVESLPPSWRVTSLNLQNPGNNVERVCVEMVEAGDVEYLAGRHFDYVVLHLCNTAMLETGNETFKNTVQGLAESAKGFIQFSFDRGMVAEYPLDFRYLFNGASLVASVTCGITRQTLPRSRTWPWIWTKRAPTCKRPTLAQTP